MILVLLLYIVSALSWGIVFFMLSKTILHLIRTKQDLPPTLLPLAIASLGIFLNSLYFGLSSVFVLLGLHNLFLAQFNSANWAIIKVLTAVSGVLMLFNLRGLNK